MTPPPAPTTPFDAPPAEGNLPLAIVAGLGAAFIGALLWMGVTVLTGYEAGLVAIAIGIVVGYAVRIAGKGSTVAFGVVGAGCALLGCMGGKALATVSMAAQGLGLGFFEMLGHTDPMTLATGIVTDSGVFTYVIFAIAAYEGYKFSRLR